MNNIELSKITRLYHLIIYLADQYYLEIENTLKEIENTNKTSKHRLIACKSTYYEICAYLLFILDYFIYFHKQKLIVREKAIELVKQEIAYNIGKEIKQDNLIEALDNRLEIYGNAIKGPNKDWGEFVRKVHFPLKQNILYSAYDNNSNKVELYDINNERPFLLIGFSKDIQLTISLGLLEEHVIGKLLSSLRILFNDNDDFTKLSIEEIDIRIQKGISEVSSSRF